MLMKKRRINLYYKKNIYRYNGGFNETKKFEGRKDFHILIMIGIRLFHSYNGCIHSILYIRLVIKQPIVVTPIIPFTIIRAPFQATIIIVIIRIFFTNGIINNSFQ